MLNQDHKTFTTILDSFLLANPDFQLSQQMKKFLLKIDNLSETFSASDAYKLYELIFRIWTLQHNTLLNTQTMILKRSLLSNHISLLSQITQKIQNCEEIKDPVLLKQQCLLIWETSINDLLDFRQSLSTSFSLQTENNSGILKNKISLFIAMLKASTKQEIADFALIICFILGITVGSILVLTGAV
jgi:hypothetical protein